MEPGAVEMANLLTRLEMWRRHQAVEAAAAEAEAAAVVVAVVATLQMTAAVQKQQVLVCWFGRYLVSRGETENGLQKDSNKIAEG